ncbi:hypothetical protein V5799_016232 [Amblyomma americanum]|uniref:Uncharacterized protein n=1 Tax=Amblyomma americanum TaxID=6943 RepID=A0AAQ4F5N3_AMBAM
MSRPVFGGTWTGKSRVDPALVEEALRTAGDGGHGQRDTAADAGLFSGRRPKRATVPPTKLRPLWSWGLWRLGTEQVAKAASLPEDDPKKGATP